MYPTTSSEPSFKVSGIAYIYNNSEERNRQMKNQPEKQTNVTKPNCYQNAPKKLSTPFNKAKNMFDNGIGINPQNMGPLASMTNVMQKSKQTVHVPTMMEQLSTSSNPNPQGNNKTDGGYGPIASMGNTIQHSKKAVHIPSLMESMSNEKTYQQPSKAEGGFGPIASMGNTIQQSKQAVHIPSLMESMSNEKTYQQPSKAEGGFGPIASMGNTIQQSKQAVHIPSLMESMSNEKTYQQPSKAEGGFGPLGSMGNTIQQSKKAVHIPSLMEELSNEKGKETGVLLRNEKVRADELDTRPRKTGADINKMKNIFERGNY